MKTLAKHLFRGVFLIAAFPMAALTAFGRFEALFLFFGQGCAMAPGILGDYLRVAYYRLTLKECSIASRIQFGSFFAHPQAKVASGVYIGCYCVLGRTSIGERTQVASGVQILSGGQQHGRDTDGRIRGSEHGTFREVTIGADCWIGAAAIVMADVGAGSTIGAGSVVTKAIPEHSVAVGSPARVIKSNEGTS